MIRCTLCDKVFELGTFVVGRWGDMGTGEPTGRPSLCHYDCAIRVQVAA